MLSLPDIERLIAVKKREIELEKTYLGLSPPQCAASENNKENEQNHNKPNKKVKFSDTKVLQDHNDCTKDKKEKNNQIEEFDDYIPSDLERYIRRYIGLPGMLKAGEYSPNNPLVRGERAPGDALLGLGEYERRRNTLRKIRQQQYREYLDQQAKKKQEEKEQAERERREREQREREREERERELVEERDRYSPDRRRSLQQIQSSQSLHSLQRDQYVQLHPLSTANNTCNMNKVDTGVQVDGFSQPLSVAVQTDDDVFGCVDATQYCPVSCVTQAERELSPRSALAPLSSPTQHTRRRSCGDYNDGGSLLKKCGNKLNCELRHTYMPSIFDADAIRLRNMQAEKEAAERRQFYQQELKNQIMEQQRIREERKNREKMLEQAELRRLEEQLRMLRVAQDRERNAQHVMDTRMKQATKDYNMKRSELQKEIDFEQEKLIRTHSQPNKNIPKRNIETSKSETISKLPLYYPQVYEKSNEITKKPYSINIPENSIFSSNYDVDSYLRKNLNFNKEKDYFSYDDEFKNTEKSEKPTGIRENLTEIKKTPDKIFVSGNSPGKTNIPERKSYETDNFGEKIQENTRNQSNIIVEKALIHENTVKNRPNNENSKNNGSIDSLPIPVLRHSPTNTSAGEEKDRLSEAMRQVEDKWKVPAVQRNILKALPTGEGNILTQLGSIRRQLQLEQLKLDTMLSKDNV